MNFNLLFKGHSVYFQENPTMNPMKKYQGDQRKQASNRNVQSCNLFSKMSRGKIFLSTLEKKT